MGKINLCMKICFFSCCAVIEIIGWLMVTGLMRGNFAADGSTAVLSWIYAVCTLVIGALGLHAGCKENKHGLKIFSGLIMVGLVANLVLGFTVVVGHNQVYRTFQDSETAGLLLEDSSFRKDIIQLQMKENCCGLGSASDWGANIPDSCSCYSYRSDCMDAPTGSQGPERVYRKTCGKLIVDTLHPMIKVAMGIYFGMASLCLLGFMMSLVMIRQVQRPDGIIPVGRA